MYQASSSIKPLFVRTRLSTDVISYMVIIIFDSCNMGTSDFPEYAQSPRATGPRAEGIHIRQIMSAHVTTIM